MCTNHIWVIREKIQRGCNIYQICKPTKSYRNIAIEFSSSTATIEFVECIYREKPRMSTNNWAKVTPHFEIKWIIRNYPSYTEKKKKRKNQKRYVIRVRIRDSINLACSLISNAIICASDNKLKVHVLNDGTGTGTQISIQYDPICNLFRHFIFCWIWLFCSALHHFSSLNMQLYLCFTASAQP